MWYKKRVLIAAAYPRQDIGNVGKKKKKIKISYYKAKTNEKTVQYSPGNRSFKI